MDAAKAVKKLGGLGIVAIDGRCCSGKTTLAELLAGQFQANVFHMDDFFLRPEQRTGERLSVPGGNVDYERFLEQVLKPTASGRPVSLRRYDCSANMLMPIERVPFLPLAIIEGSYSLHPALREYMHLGIALTCDSATQLRRVRIRSPEQSDEFKNRWIPLEELYLEHCAVFETAELVIDTSGLF